jgi:hypothetical protein
MSILRRNNFGLAVFRQRRRIARQCFEPSERLNSLSQISVQPANIIGTKLRSIRGRRAVHQTYAARDLMPYLAPLPGNCRMRRPGMVCKPQPSKWAWCGLARTRPQYCCRWWSALSTGIPGIHPVPMCVVEESSSLASARCQPWLCPCDALSGDEGAGFAKQGRLGVPKLPTSPTRLGRSIVA